VVLINHDLLRDAMCEMGIALGSGKPVFVLYPDRRTSVFFHRTETFQEMVALLERLRRAA
jgi:hypothetical protein